MATVFTNAGKAFVAGLMSGDTSKPAAWYVAQGTGTNSAAATDTTLQTESAESRVSAGNGSRQTGSVTNDTFRASGTITATGTRAITEAGLFTASTSGTLIVRGDFSVINVNSGDSIAFTFDLKFQ